MIVESILKRRVNFLGPDVRANRVYLNSIVEESSFLVLGGAGSIGQAVIKEIFKRNPAKLHVVDISENNLVELVRDLRSTYGYIKGDFKTFALDIGSWQYDAFIENDGLFDYVLNLSALKHVRSEKDPFTLMRMIEVNIFNTDKTIRQSIEKGSKKYFCVSTDKAAYPVNMMGASKRIMEMFLTRRAQQISISTARFANVAFSDGSLLHGFIQRLAKGQPIAAPSDIKRYFVTHQESGELCLMSCLLGDNGDIFFPKLDEELHQITFSEIAIEFLKSKGFEACQCSSEQEARLKIETLPSQSKWPCYFSTSDTTGEKDYEEFYEAGDRLDLSRFKHLGVIKNDWEPELDRLEAFENQILKMRQKGIWDKEEILSVFKMMLPDFHHVEKGKYLDSKM